MKMSYDVHPFSEALLYLESRFTDYRTSDRILEACKKNTRMNNSDLLFCDKLCAFEQELDSIFECDETMRRYFSPLKTKEALPTDEKLTIGGMLLNIPGDLDNSCSFDDLVRLYHSWPKDVLTHHFFTESLASFFSEGTEEKDMAAFISLADKMLVETDEKWALVDAAANPFPHLERLRPLICTIEAEIKKRLPEFEPWLKSLMDELRTYGDDETILKSIFRFDLKKPEIEKAFLYPSLFSFNRVKLSPSSAYFSCIRSNGGHVDASLPEKVKIEIGVYTVSLVRKANTGNPNDHLYFLKLISDPMRFNVLHDMCDKYTYGLELAEKYKTTRSAMYYHLEKLLGNGLITLKSTDYRMLYTINKRNVYDKLNAMRDYILKGWKPEDDEKKAEVEEEKE